MRAAPPLDTPAAPAAMLIVSMANSTVDTIRAQLLPALQLWAIQSHSAAPISPLTMNRPIATCSAWVTWADVRFGLLLIIWFLVELSVVKSTTMPIRLTAAPAYMTCTALSTDCGVGGREGSGIVAPPGYGWYMAAPLAGEVRELVGSDTTPRATRRQQGPPSAARRSGATTGRPSGPAVTVTRAA